MQAVPRPEGRPYPSRSRLIGLARRFQHPLACEVRSYSEGAAGTALLSDTYMTHPNLTHHGGATGVTGSCHRLQLAADHALLVDCGLFQGKDAEPSTTPVGASPARERAAVAPIHNAQGNAPLKRSQYGTTMRHAGHRP